MTDHESLDLHALEGFFAANVPGFRGGLRSVLLQGGRSNLTFRVTDGHTSWVLRRPPLGGLTPSAHDMRREYRVVSALADSAVPVPAAVALGDATILGVPFSVVEHVVGAVVRSEEELDRLSDDAVTACGYALIDVLSDLHAIDPQTVGLADFGRAEGFLTRQVTRWYEQWKLVQTRELADITTLHTQLLEACPAQFSDAAIVHGDFRIDNVILGEEDPSRIRAVIDWEMATLGDPLADLGLHLVYADPLFAPVLAESAASTSDRLPSTQDLAQRYAESSGRDLSRLDFYVALGYFKIAVIAEGIHARFQQGLTRGEGFESVGGATAPLAAAGLRASAGVR